MQEGDHSVGQVFPFLHDQASRPVPKCQLPSLAAKLPLLTSQGNSNWLQSRIATTAFYYSDSSSTVGRPGRKVTLETTFSSPESLQAELMASFALLKSI